MEIVLGIILGVIILTVLVVIHELGHGIVARRNGVVVEEFGVGFPPKAWSKKVAKSVLGKNVEFSLNWLPLGGFVKLQGEHDEDNGKKGDFGGASFWAKTKILLAGVVMNWITAMVIFSGLALFGIPKMVDNQFVVGSDVTHNKQTPFINFIAEGSPAETAGLKVDDKLISVAGEKLDSATDLPAITEANKGEMVAVQYERGGAPMQAMVQLRSERTNEQGYLGASAFQFESYRSTWSAPVVGVGLTAQLSWLTLQGVGQMAGNFVSGLVQKINPSDAAQEQANQKLEEAGASVAGPVGLLGVILPAMISQGPVYMLLIAGIISLSLAVLNTLPIPGLDGGRWFLIALFKVLKKPLSKEREEKIVGAGMVFLMGLIVLITIADIGKFF